MVSAVIGHFTWSILAFSLLSLTAIRMIPMFLALTASGETASAKLFLGWFGPRGLASIVFMIIVLGRDTPNGETMAVTVVCTVALSVVLHGLTANPLSARFVAARSRKEGV